MKFNKNVLGSLIKVSTVSAAAAGLIACGAADNPSVSLDAPTIEYAELRVLHASGDAPSVTVTVDGNTAFGSVAYGEAKPFFAVPVGTGLEVVVTATVPGYEEDDEATSATLFTGTVDFAVGTSTDIVAHGDVVVANYVDDQTTDATARATNALSASVTASETTDIKIGHFAANAPAAVDLHAAASCATLSTATKIADLAYGSSVTLAASALPTTAYEVCVTADGGTAAVFDSGTVSLAGGMWINAIDNTADNSTSPVMLSVTSGGASSMINHTDGNAEIRFVHASSDAGAVSIDMGEFGAAQVVTLAGVTLGTASAYQNVATNDAATDNSYILSVSNGTGELVRAEDLVFTDTDVKTVIVAGLETFDADDEADAEITGIILDDDIRNLATEARLRVIHASAAARDTTADPVVATVDVFLNKQTTPALDITAKDADDEFVTAPTLAGVAFGADTGYISLEDGAVYDLIITLAGDPDRTTVLSGTINADAGETYYLIVNDDGTTVSINSIGDAT